MNIHLYLHEFAMLMAAHMMAVISPGADFALVVSRSVSYGKRVGFGCALGIGCGLLVHLFYTLGGIAAVLGTSPSIFIWVRYLGAAYIAYLGISLVRSFWQTRHAPVADIRLQKDQIAPSFKKAFLSGLFTNVLNPKATLFFVAVFTTIVSIHTPLSIQVGYGAAIFISTVAWFGCVTLFLSSAPVRRRFLQIRPYFELCCGLLLLFFASRLVWAA